MIFGVLEVVHYLSQFMVLEPGDLINTGTPPGVGMGMKPPTYLRAGDVVELRVDGLGTQRQQPPPRPLIPPRWRKRRCSAGVSSVRRHLIRAVSTQVDDVFRRQLRLTRMTQQIEVPSPAHPADALAAVVALRRLADRLEYDAVARAVEQGWTWAQVAEALGVTPPSRPQEARQAVLTTAPREDDEMLTRKRADMRTIKALLTRAEEIAHRPGRRRCRAPSIWCCRPSSCPTGRRGARSSRSASTPAPSRAALIRQYDDALATFGIDAAGIDPATSSPDQEVAPDAASARAARGLQSAAVMRVKRAQADAAHRRRRRGRGLRAGARRRRRGCWRRSASTACS